MAGAHPHVNILDDLLRRDRRRGPYRQDREQHEGRARQLSRAGRRREPVARRRRDLVREARAPRALAREAVPRGEVPLPRVRRAHQAAPSASTRSARRATNCRKITASSSPAATTSRAATTSSSTATTRASSSSASSSRRTARTSSTSTTRAATGAICCCRTTSSARRSRARSAANGYSLFPDGTMAVFRAVTEATRVHPLQIWRTPFTSAEWAASAPKDGSYLSKVGNADLVRGISDAFSLRKLAATRSRRARDLRGSRRRDHARHRRALLARPRRSASTSCRRSRASRRRRRSSSTSSTRSRRSRSARARRSTRRARSRSSCCSRPAPTISRSSRTTCAR